MLVENNIDIENLKLSNVVTAENTQVSTISEKYNFDSLNLFDSKKINKKKAEEGVGFQIRGSQGDIYDVGFLLDIEADYGVTPNLTANCTCPAGKKQSYCTHVFQILTRKVDNLVSDNATDVKEVQKWVANSDVANAILDLELAEAELLLDTSDENITTYRQLKSQLAKALYD